MNSFHCSRTINGCLVNGSSPFLIISRLSCNLNCLHALAAVFQKSLNAYGFASSRNFKCFCTCISNKSHFSSFLSSLISGKFKGIFCLATSQRYWHPHYVDLSYYHCVTWSLCRCPWPFASAPSPTHLVLLCTSGAITLFFILWPRSIVLVRIIL
jgi:hypothetical protein